MILIELNNEDLIRCSWIFNSICWDFDILMT